MSTTLKTYEKAQMEANTIRIYSVVDVVGLLADPENQPHQFVGREDLLMDFLVNPIRHVLDQWKEAQGSLMGEDLQELIEEIEQHLGR